MLVGSKGLCIYSTKRDEAGGVEEKFLCWWSEVFSHCWSLREAVTLCGSWFGHNGAVTL